MTAAGGALDFRKDQLNFKETERLTGFLSEIQIKDDRADTLQQSQEAAAKTRR